MGLSGFELLYLFHYVSGCLLDETLCDADEDCVQDGLFGQCYSGSEDAVSPIILEEDLTPEQVVYLNEKLLIKFFLSERSS